ncbi:polysaccharide pyruvyl transferase family protein [Empedobacter brevis]|uniref:polysaccharide pyruvyl transferase family protein n=1 Tax=Empedobacter brevis TaxID=247 RepID=UPI002FE15F90
MENVFSNLDKIENLRNTVRNALTKHIDGDYVLLDVPNHRNIGDLLIWEGELEYLKEIPFKMIYSSNDYTYKETKVKEGDIILLHGGGNFGDVWRSNQDFRNQIIKKFPNNKIIILPQTVQYNDPKYIKEDAELYNSHKNLIICARDNESYNFCNQHFKECIIYKLPDLAFFLDFQKYHLNKFTNQTLILKRMDKELGDESLIKNIENSLSSTSVHIADWPGFYKNRTLKRRVQYYSILLERKLSENLKYYPFINNLIDDKHGLKGKNYKEKLILKGINFINQYDTVYSTRLHGFILSVLLNKKVYIFDNSYGKNKNFFNTWLSDFDNVELIEK